jgi:ATP-dependent Clp protease protease subunit
MATTLDDEGVLMLTGEIDRNSAHTVIRGILEHNLRHTRDFIRLYIDSPGGHVDAGFALIDIMRWSRLPIRTTGMGLVGSMGLLVFAAGARGFRTLMPNTTILSHRFSTSNTGNHADLVAARVREDMVWNRILDHYRTCTGVADRNLLELDLLRPTNRWMTPEETVAAGLADRIWSDPLPEAG